MLTPNNNLRRKVYDSRNPQFIPESNPSKYTFVVVGHRNNRKLESVIGYCGNYETAALSAACGMLDYGEYKNVIMEDWLNGVLTSRQRVR